MNKLHMRNNFLNKLFLWNRYRRLALKYHPLRNPTDIATNSVRFAEICEAFDVLSNRKFKYLLLN